MCVIDSGRVFKSALVSTNGLWMNGYLMANPEDGNLNDQFSRGESKKWLSSNSVKSASNQRPAFAARAGRLQSLCLFGSACESYNDHAIMNAEHSSSEEVDRGLPHDISDSVKKEVHDAIDAELNEQDLDHVIKTGSPTNAFCTHRRVSPITLVTMPEERARHHDSNYGFLDDAECRVLVESDPSSKFGILLGGPGVLQEQRFLGLSTYCNQTQTKKKNSAEHEIAKLAAKENFRCFS